MIWGSWRCDKNWRPRRYKSASVITAAEPLHAPWTAGRSIRFKTRVPLPEKPRHRSCARQQLDNTRCTGEPIVRDATTICVGERLTRPSQSSRAASYVAMLSYAKLQIANCALSPLAAAELSTLVGGKRIARSARHPFGRLAIRRSQYGDLADDRCVARPRDRS